MKKKISKIYVGCSGAVYSVTILRGKGEYPKRHDYHIKCTSKIFRSVSSLMNDNRRTRVHTALTVYPSFVIEIKK